jgi:hypothetical protein
MLRKELAHRSCPAWNFKLLKVQKKIKRKESEEKTV